MAEAAVGRRVLAEIEETSLDQVRLYFILDMLFLMPAQE